MRFLSVCSGIEAASMAWGCLGWQAVAFSEIDPFASAVLAERHPGVPNLGDLTKYRDWPTLEFDILVGGTPCQDLSVAGKRAGLAGERSGLFFDFIGVAARYKPKYIVWENVPGVLSTNEGNDIQTVIDELTQIGYACDLDILDAQCFGLAQRRRRIFVICVRLDVFLSKRTHTSARIAAELLLQPLLDTWAAILQAWCPVKTLSGYAHPIELSVDFAAKRMSLLDKALDGSACTKLLSALDGSQVLSTDEPRRSALSTSLRSVRQVGGSEVATGGLPSIPMMAGESGVKSIVTSWNSILADLSNGANKFTTKTSTSKTTASEICTFASQTLTIGGYITNLTGSSGRPTWSEDFWNLASLLLTMMEAVTTYARYATEDLFGDASLRDDWRAHLDTARELARQSQRNLGAGAGSGSLFSIPESLSGNPAPRREAGKRVAPTVEARANAGGAGWGTDFLVGGGLAAEEVARAVKAGHKGHRDDPTTDNFIPVAFGGNDTRGPIEVATACRAKGGTGHGDFESETFVAEQVALAFKPSHYTRGKDGAPSDVAPPLSADADKGDQDTLVLAFDETRNEPGEGLIAHALRAEGFDASEDGTGRGTPLVPIAFSAKDHGADAMTDCAPTLRAGGHSESHANAGVMPAIAFHARQDPDSGPVTHPLDTDGTSIGILHHWRVRRLTPLECERLQGFPDGHTKITYRGKPAADGPRYKSLGNSMAVPVMKWIGQRIKIVDAL